MALRKAETLSGQGVGGVGGVGGNAAFIDVQLFNFSSFSPPSSHSKSKLYQGFAINLVPFDTALKFAPNDLKTLKRKGFALEKLSELQLSQQHYTEAIKALKQAIGYDSAFSR